MSKSSEELQEHVRKLLERSKMLRTHAKKIDTGVKDLQRLIKQERGAPKSGKAATDQRKR